MGLIKIILAGIAIAAAICILALAGILITAWI